MQNITVPDSSINSNSNVICSCNCTGSQSQGMDISELEFVQIIIIIVVMTVMVVVIICLLNHYRLSAWAFFTRQSQARRRDQAMQPEGCSWPTDSLVAQQGATEVMYGPRSAEPQRFAPPSFMQQRAERFCRFQPTYPYLQQDIDLPPTICLSDGEELPPYKGPCTLQLRDPEQQLELSRASVRAPPNRTIFDSDLIDVYVHGGGGGGGGGGSGGTGPRPPSSNSGKSASSVTTRMEGPPPTYSEVMGQMQGHGGQLLAPTTSTTSSSSSSTASSTSTSSASTTSTAAFLQHHHHHQHHQQQQQHSNNGQRSTAPTPTPSQPQLQPTHHPHPQPPLGGSGGLTAVPRVGHQQTGSSNSSVSTTVPGKAAKDGRRRD